MRFTTDSTEIEKLSLIATELRREVIAMLAKSKSGHPAGALGMAEVFTALYFSEAKVNPKKPLDKKRDYIVLSNGHICPILYASLAHRGYFKREILETLRKLNSPLQGHPHRGALPGIETSSGPLGSGLSQASGMALGLKLDGKKNTVFCITSDGEHDEGNTWEAVLFAAKYNLNNLIQIIDRNRIQIDGNTGDVMPLGSLKQKYQSFGWHVIDLDGQVLPVLIHAIREAKAVKDRPSVIIANNIPGKGVSFMENDHHWHGKAPTADEAAKALAELK